MKLRKIEKIEHEETRALYEAVFTEDSKAFLDYYYTYKANHNAIYVIEEDKGYPFAMLHLNPYDIRVGDACVRAQYIIAVATLPAYRKQGLMRKLLMQSLSDLRAEGEAFTFLMPAHESIYLPFDFRFIYSQPQGAGGGDDGEISSGIEIKQDDIPLSEAACFANDYLKKKFSVYTHRSKEYYHTLALESKCENGNLVALMEGEKIVGLFSYVIGERVEVREPLVLEEYRETFFAILSGLSTGNQKPYVIRGDVLSENIAYKPMIMARILNLEKMMALVKAKEDFDITLRIRDGILQMNDGYFHFYAKEGNPIETRIGKRNKSNGEVSIGDLISFLFAYSTLEELIDVTLDDKGKDELAKLCLLTPSFINEIV